jgi:hypothetical protein
MPTTRVKVTLRGPVLNGKTRGLLRPYLDRAVDEVADLGVNQIRAVLGSRLKHPTGYYESRVQTDRSRGMGSRVITDGGVVYGPWLEGTSHRNQTTRFKGYRAFRRTRTRLRKLGDPIVNRLINQFVARLGGR